jgi:hypothetical protein
MSWQLHVTAQLAIYSSSPLIDFNWFHETSSKKYSWSTTAVLICTLHFSVEPVISLISFKINAECGYKNIDEIASPHYQNGSQTLGELFTSPVRARIDDRRLSWNHDGLGIDIHCGSIDGLNRRFARDASIRT